MADMTPAQRSAVTTLALGALVAFTPGTALADDAQTVINQYKSQGYQVIVNRSGSAPTNKCIVTNVRDGSGPTQTDYVPILTSGHNWLMLPRQTPGRKMVYITLDCNA